MCLVFIISAAASSASDTVPRQWVKALASSAWSTALVFSTFGKSLSRKQWLGFKAVLDSDPGQWPGNYCASDSTDSSAWVIGLEQCQAVLKHCMPVLVTAEHCSGPMPAVVRSYAGSAWALLRHRNQVYKCPIKGTCMVSQESNLTWLIALEFLRAVFSLFKALKKILLAITTGIYKWERIPCLNGHKNISMRNEIKGLHK